MIPYQKTRFVTSAVDAAGYPVLVDHRGTPLPEIAFVGRSNVGKSSLINSLTQQKSLARTSSTPGKTQLINFFLIENHLVMVDLPGFGYAKVPLEVRQEWQPMISTYMKQRESLKLLLLLVDIRREPALEDRQLIEWAHFHGKRVLLVLTKVDKLNHGEKQRQTQLIEKALGWPSGNRVHYSSSHGIGRNELISAIGRELARTIDV